MLFLYGDINGLGKVGFHEAKRMTELIKGPLDEGDYQRLQADIDKLDGNHDGYLTFGELTKLK